MSDFSTLPAEIREKILRNEPRASLTLSREYPQLLSRSLLKKLCFNPVSNSEFISYLQNDHPRLFAIYKPSNSITYPLNTGDIMLNNVAAAYIYTLSSGETWNCNIIPTMLGYDDPDNLEVYALQPIISIDPQDSNKIVALGLLDHSTIFDVLTLYRILRKRFGCMQIDPNFAKTATIEYFNTIVSNHYNLHNPIYLLDLYCYLAAHTWIFNLSIPINEANIDIDITNDRIPVAESVEQPEVEALFDQIPVLIEAIYQRLGIIELLA